MRGRWRSWSNRTIRWGLFLLLLIPAQRYLDGLLPLWLPVALFAIALVAERLCKRRLASAMVSAVSSALVIPAVTLGAVALLWIGAVPLERAGWWEQQLLLSPWHLLPAALLAETAMLWELSVRRRIGRTLFVPLATVAVVAIFWSQARFELSLFPHPSWYAAYAVLAAVGLITHQATTGTPRGGGRGRVMATVVVASILLIASGIAFRGWQSRAVEAGGGLLRPTAFQFDFADYVSLEPEISLSRDLVFLYRESQAPRDRLLRRYVLSGYSPRRGFYRLDSAQEPSPAPPLSVQAAIDGELTGGDGVKVDQEFYIVNFDPDALIAVNAPEQVERIGTWSESSFNNAYRVASHHPSPDLDSLQEAPWPRNLPKTWREVYLKGPVPEGVAALAREITADAQGYYETVEAVLSHLLNEYYYSLSPGEALAGNQLEHFLFESRKGYCSYFAFSMTLMLRSLDIPSRVAVGFFTDPGAAMLEFYPVRGDMAHAWVEVWFEEFGWVEFDPTSQQIAPGETVSTDYQIDQQRLSQLIQEVLSRRDDSEQPTTGGEGPRATPERDRWTAIQVGLGAAVLIVVPLWYWRRRRWSALRASHPRRAALLVLRRLRRLRRGSSRSAGGTRRTTVHRPDPKWGAKRALVSQLEERARFARDFSHPELQELEAALPPRVIRSVRLLPPGTSSVRFRRLGRRAPGRAFVVLLVLGLLVTAAHSPVVAQEPLQEAQSASADEMLQRAEDAVQAENYDQALRWIRRGREAFSGDPRFPTLQGDVFFDQNLFSGARDAYQAALEAGAPQYSTRYALSRTLARLNEDRAAVHQLEQLHQRYPDDLTVIGDLAWQYFKLHRLPEAQRLLEDVLEDLPDDRDLLMTLATVYSGLWDFSKAEETYRRAIDAAEQVNDRVFQAVAYYNLSILYANFHRYDEAFSAAERSLETAERSSGYMIRGELRELELSPVGAASDYRRAGVLDEVSPLAELSSAALWAQEGYPRRAIARLDRITENDSGNWMYNYGTDPARYQRQLYTAYAEAYTALAHRLKVQRRGRWTERLAAVAEWVVARSRAWYYRGLERRQRRRIAENYAEAERELLSLWNRMIAAEHRPRVAVRHAVAAEAIETVFNPSARLEYQLFTAGVTDDEELMTGLLPELQGRWQQHNRATALRGVYRIRRTGPEALQAAAEAWILAPGQMVSAGLRVPVAIGGIEISELSSSTVTQILRRMGFRIAPESPLVLELTGGQGEMQYQVHERHSSREVRRGTVRYGQGTDGARRAVEEIALTLTRADEAVIHGEEP